MIGKTAFGMSKNGIPWKNKCFCRTPELIENYDKAIADTTCIWECHHRNERFYTRQELKDLGLYYDCPPCELIFLTPEEHRKVDQTNREHSIKHNKSMSKSLKGKYKGHHWYNNGIKSIHASECPEGFVPGRISWK